MCYKLILTKGMFTPQSLFKSCRSLLFRPGGLGLAYMNWAALILHNQQHEDESTETKFKFVGSTLLHWLAWGTKSVLFTILHCNILILILYTTYIFISFRVIVCIKIKF